jgi:hypothetical protein
MYPDGIEGGGAGRSLMVWIWVERGEGWEEMGRGDWRKRFRMTAGAARLASI